MLSPDMHALLAPKSSQHSYDLPITQLFAYAKFVNLHVSGLGNVAVHSSQSMCDFSEVVRSKESNSYNLYDEEGLTLSIDSSRLFVSLN